MSSTEKPYRNELKFLCTTGMLEILEHRLLPVMHLDEYSVNGSYVVSSLYFDDYHDSCCLENEMGISERYKYRIRIYNDDAAYIRLEKKSKRDSKCRKKSCQLNEETCRKLCCGEVGGLLFDASRPLVRELSIQIRTRFFRPKVIIRYERKAFVYPQGDVRVTMDRNISASLHAGNFPGAPGGTMAFPVLDHGMHLLEVKYNDVLPYYIYQTIQMNTLQRTTFSKYYIGRKAARQYGGGVT